MGITGNKVILRAVEERDKEMLQNLMEDPAKVLGGYSPSASWEHQMEWFLSAPKAVSGLRRIIAERQDPGNALGIIVLSNVNQEQKTAEIYIKLMKAARRKGYGEDAVTALVSYGFCELGLDRVVSNILEYNTASRRLFEKCGFTQEGVHQSRTDRDGHGRMVCVYEKYREE